MNRVPPRVSKEQLNDLSYTPSGEDLNVWGVDYHSPGEPMEWRDARDRRFLYEHHRDLYTYLRAAYPQARYCVSIDFSKEHRGELNGYVRDDYYVEVFDSMDVYDKVAVVVPYERVVDLYRSVVWQYDKREDKHRVLTKPKRVHHVFRNGRTLYCTMHRDYESWLDPINVEEHYYIVETRRKLQALIS